MKPEISLPNRREFLAAGAGLVLAANLTRMAGAGGAEPLRIAVIGTGGRGSDLLRKLTTISAVQIVAVCDDYPPHLKNGLEYAGSTTTPYSDYRQMLDKTKPAAVVVAVPLWLHFQVCTDVIAAGCDVFCEKTMCYNLEQARQLAATVSAAKCIFQVGLQRRANSIYRQARAMVEAGMIGRITAIKAQWHRNNNWRRPVPVGRNDPKWDELERRLNWRLYKKFSQGLMAELGSHQLDVVNWLLGVPPARVMATGGIDYWRDGREVADNVFCTYEYSLSGAPSGGEPAGPGPHTVRVTYSSLCNNAYEGASELIMGTRGTLFLTDKKGLLYSEQGADDVGWVKQNAGANASIVTSGKTLGLTNDPWADRGKPTEIDNDQGDDTRDELVSFVEHVRARDGKTICDVQEGLRNAATILMANEAMETGKTVEFPADLRAQP